MNIPDGATDYIQDYSRIVYYKRVKVFNMNFLVYWTGSQWNIVCGYLPWNEIRPIEELQNV